MASRGCIHPADAFCYVCGHFTKTRVKKYSVEASAKMCEAYKAYFGMPVGDQDKPWAPHFTCWYRGEKRAMHFAVPRIWREPTDQSTNCYFCIVDPSKRHTGKNATPVTYPDIPSSIAPVPHCPELPVPTLPDRATPPSEESSRSDTQEDVEDHDFSSCADEERKPYYPNQKDLNDLIRDLGLTKSNAELLTSRLKQWNLLDESIQVTGQRKCHQVFSVGKNNVKWEPLVDPRKVLMPPLHIKLGLIKQFVRALDKELRAFNYLQDLFPKLSEAKIKAGVFVGPQIKKIIECSEFPKKLNRKDRAAWNSFVAVVRGFLGNHKDENYVQLVQTLIKNYAAMGCRMSLKIHILDAHLDKFKENMGAYSEEQRERFHRDIMNFECRYQRQYNENMMGDYIWGLIRESDLQYSRKSRKTTHF
ncbi:uncharacterized protein LOC119264997 isoform X2 [Pygocentrus nattereri]|uniref:uncharacterized protein LOC119264997 isoform X2 n=1 Tax=Pygocentrus nattereri TaxID=42514 RepID=UPI001891B711|nr:uncharacterized protein LOC119264997 isoform X2 [Pygocentrus nattereri]